MPWPWGWKIPHEQGLAHCSWPRHCQGSVRSRPCARYLRVLILNLTHTLSSRLLSYRRWDDIIQAELGNNLKEDGTIQGRPAADVVKDKTALDPDKPGLGQYYCVACARYCISAKALADHQSQKKHKRRLKTLLTEKPYSHAEANAAAGRGATDHGLSRDRAAVPEAMST